MLTEQGDNPHSPAATTLPTIGYWLSGTYEVFVTLFQTPTQVFFDSGPTILLPVKTGLCSVE